jgi:GntR family transcriptional regulator
MQCYIVSRNRSKVKNELSEGTVTKLDAGDLSQLLGRFNRPGLPKYMALHDAVLHAVASGQLAPGTRMPNEQELAEVLPLSLGTIQRALRQLVDERVIHRTPGQGSFVCERGSDGQMEHPFHCRFVNDDGSGYLPVYPEVVSRERVSAPGEWSLHLRCPEATRIDRVIRVADEFSVYTSFMIDAARLPVFRTLSVEKLSSQNFKEIIFRACGQAIHKVDLLLRQQAAPREVAARLGIGARQACTSIRALACLGETDPIYYQCIWIPANERRLHIVSDSRAPGLAG